MINFPRLEQLIVEGYELYPGTTEDPGLSVEFRPGVTLIIGANGLGKSTIILLLFRMLSGSAEVTGQGMDELGSGKLAIRSLYRHELRTFGARVADGATKANATIRFALGDTSIEATRDLNSLTLTNLAIDDEAQDADESIFRLAVAEAAGVEAFLDWLLILRYLIFYFDDRRSLVWDPTAQRRMLPLLFLPASEVSPIEELTARVLSRDSTVRNLAAALTKQERELKAQERALSAQPALFSELEELLADRIKSEERLAQLQQGIVDLESTRARTRLDYLQAADNRQSAATQLEEVRLGLIRQAFPSTDESSAYLITKLFTESQCLVCATQAPEAAAELRQRIDEHRCVICGSRTSQDGASPIAEEQVPELRKRLIDAEATLAIAASDRDEAEAAYESGLTNIAKLTHRISEATRRINRLERALPDADRSMSKRREAINELKAQNAIAREEVLQDKMQLAEMVAAQNQQLSQYKDAVKSSFDSHAEEFLVETCSLIWGSHSEQIGQLGRGIPFSVFQIDMTGGGTDTATRRESAYQVSESQREFIDIAFRMALISVASDGGGASLVIDAPESSLDAVFAPRAADVLTGFGRDDGLSRVVITSNLVDGQLIPRISEKSGITGPDHPRVVNLFEIAAKTAALRKLQAKYDAAMERAFRAPGLSR